MTDDGMNALQRKRAKNKAKRDAEKAARKDANKAKVDATKKTKTEKPKTKTDKSKDDGKRVCKTVWESLDLEKQGIYVKPGEAYELPRGKSAGPTKVHRQMVKVENRRSHHKGGSMTSKVCVKTAKGEKVRAHRDEAARLVANGGKYIPKHQFKDEWKGKK